VKRVYSHERLNRNMTPYYVLRSPYSTCRVAELYKLRSAKKPEELRLTPCV